MGHFGDLFSTKSITADSMITIRRFQHGAYHRDTCVNIMSLYNSFKVWFREHNNIYHPYDNDPLMINLE